MRAYIPFDSDATALDRPEEVKKIDAYLREHGKVLVNLKTLERLYYNFSHKRCAGWLIVDEENLEDFAEWLAGVDL